MKRIVIIFTVLVFPNLLMGQTKKFEYTPKVKSKVEISNLNGEITLQNSGGNTLIIESDFNFNSDRPERAEGLKLLGAMEDNTDLGVNVSEENGMVSIMGATRHISDCKYKILVPQGIAVSVNYKSPFAKSNVNVDSFVGSLDISAISANVKIVKSSGPFSINTMNGNLEIVYDKINQSEPTSLATINGIIDITLPDSEKANIEINTMLGNVYNNLSLKIASSKEGKDERASGMNAISTHNSNSYTLNGGGQKVYLKTISGNIYLRKR